MNEDPAIDAVRRARSGPAIEGRLLDGAGEERLAALPYSFGHGARPGQLGFALFYYSLAYGLKAQLCVCLGSGGGLVPILMRRAQRDAGIIGAKTVLIDAVAPEAGFGGPDVVHGWFEPGSRLRRDYPDVHLLCCRTDEAATEFFARNPWRIDYLHIDADHSYEGCLDDIRRYAGLVGPHGAITLHDTRMDGVARAIDETLRRDPAWEVLDFADIGQGLALARRPQSRTRAAFRGAYLSLEADGTVEKNADAMENDMAGPWPYLESEALKSRYVLAGAWLADAGTIVEVGSYRTPIADFVHGTGKTIVCVDPLILDPGKSVVAGNTIERLQADFDGFDYERYAGADYAVVFLGMDMTAPDKMEVETARSIARFLHFVSRAKTAVVEVPIHWSPAARQLDALLSALRPKIEIDVTLDLSATAFDEGAPPASRLVRRMLKLSSFSQPELSALSSHVARILYGPAVARLIAGGEDFEVVSEEDLAAGRFEIAYDKARLDLRDDGAVSIATSGEPWSYAAILKFAPEPRPGLVQVLKLTIEVQSGQVDLGIIHADWSEIACTRTVSADMAAGPTRIDLIIPPNTRPNGLVVRNSGDATPGACVVSEIRLVGMVDRQAADTPAL